MATPRPSREAPPTSYSNYDYSAPQRLSTIPSEAEGSVKNGNNGNGNGAVAGPSNVPPTTPSGGGNGGGAGYQTPAARYAKRKASDLESTSLSTQEESPPHNNTLPRSSLQAAHRGSTSSARGGTERAAKGKTRFQISPEHYEPRPIRRSSGSSNIPTSYREAKRARLSTSSATGHQEASSSTSAPTTRPSSPQGLKPPSIASTSIPISALLSPHAPSLTPSSRFHMRDPKKPRIERTPWTIRFADNPPIQCWCFLFGFILPFIWVAGGWVVRVPTTRKLGSDVESANGQSGGKEGVWLDDPQVEHDAKTWQTRNRWAAFISLFTYLPFIIIVAYFGSRA